MQSHVKFNQTLSKASVIPTISAIGNSFTSNKFLQPASRRSVEHLLATIQIRLALHPYRLGPRGREICPSNVATRRANSMESTRPFLYLCDILPLLFHFN